MCVCVRACVLLEPQCVEATIYPNLDNVVSDIFVTNSMNI